MAEISDFKCNGNPNEEILTHIYKDLPFSDLNSITFEKIKLYWRSRLIKGLLSKLIYKGGLPAWQPL